MVKSRGVAFGLGGKNDILGLDKAVGLSPGVLHMMSLTEFGLSC